MVSSGKLLVFTFLKSITLQIVLIKLAFFSNFQETVDFSDCIDI